ncbi:MULTISPECIES: acrylyl-CoA reductase (NADPH) [unclassified Salinivibrio]|uniref:acrylyl-CoA reductase (NADPH) n=1 Tax=unclassified Salinivibrio TaxID=2636825 RepID=UPI000984AFD2|nr:MULTISPECIES: MDR family oxidoreductase [unclassified Salinivibrio]OOE91846.1 oxidoreductase [Salinivibrio sp. AR640]OOF01771.1 oxidoreductase [Salinivibrio sp. MA440]
MFNALVLEQHEKQTLANITALAESDLPDGNVTVDIDYSSLNYKDGLAITGKGKIVRQFPMVPGIDFAGTVADSQHPDYQPGDKVVLTGWGVGEGHWGGMAEKARVNGDWLVPLAEGLTEQQAMMVGTAGLTAMLCVQALIDGGVKPEDGKVLVTGASGGVGSVAVTLLHALGYRVSAVTGRLDANQTWLEQLGANDVLPRDAFSAPGRPLDKQHWAGAVDTVGSQMLANVLSQIQYGGTVAACGLAGGFDLPATVMPFILRNVRLQGVDSVSCPRPQRLAAWQSLTKLLPARYFEQACHTIALAQTPAYADKIINGEIKGRVVIDITKQD